MYSSFPPLDLSNASFLLKYLTVTTIIYICVNLYSHLNVNCINCTLTSTPCVPVYDACRGCDVVEIRRNCLKLHICVRTKEPDFLIEN